MTPAEILERAADVIDAYGHAKNTYGDFARGHCASGAICVADGQSNDLSIVRLGKTADAAWLSLDAALEPVQITNWNDASERTKDEVTSTLRAVAATLRAQSEVKETVPA